MFCLAIIQDVVNDLMLQGWELCREGFSCFGIWCCNVG